MARSSSPPWRLCAAPSLPTALVLGLLAGCPADPGAVDFRLLWPADLGGVEQVHLRGRVRLGGGAGVVEATPTGPIRVGGAASLELSGVPNGVGHVVVVELTEAVDSELVLYFGESAPFDLEPGPRRVVEVPLVLRRPPTVGSAEAAVTIESRGGFVSGPDVVLVLRTGTGNRAEVSNQPGFLGGVASLDLSELEGAGPSCPPAPGAATTEVCAYRVPWDLDSGLDDTCSGRDACPRSVFVRFRDASGYRSAAASASVTVDTVAPRIIEQTIDPSPARPSEPLVVRFGLQETVRAGDLRLDVLPTAALPAADVAVSRLYPAPADDEALVTNFSFALAPRAEWPSALDDAPFGLQVTVSDRAGNRAVPTVLSPPRFDSRPPTVSGLRIEPAVATLGVTDVTVGFELDAPATGRILLGPAPVPGGGVGVREVALGPDCEQAGVPAAGRRVAWRCRLELRSFDLGAMNGDALPVRIEVLDEARNIGGANGALTVDHVPPRPLDVALVTYRPAAGNPVANPSRATHGTEIRVRIGFDEPIDVGFAPELVATSSSSTLAFGLVSADLVSAEFRVTVDSARHGDGVYRPRLALRDLAGNVNRDGRFSSPSLLVDVSPPLLVVQQDGVSYVRAPVSSRLDEPLTDASGQVAHVLPAGPNVFAIGPADPLAPVASLPGDAFRLADGELPTVLRFYGDPSQRLFLGDARPDGGVWPRDALRLAPIEAPGVWVSGVDGAGNASELVRIERTWYVAAPGVSVTGERPHEVSSQPAVRAPLVEGRPELAESLEQPDGLGVVRRAGHVWRQRALAASPSFRSLSHMVCDTARGYAMVFGGRGLNDLWAFDDAGWRRIEVRSNSPRNRGRGAFAYDRKRGRTILYGGQGDAGTANPTDTWAFDGESWREIRTSSSPASRWGPTMVYDPRRDRMVMFGGYLASNTPRPDALWEFDGEDWYQPVPTSTRSPPLANRPSTSLVYDEARGHVLLYGNQAPIGFGDIHDAWTWDGERWTEIPLTGDRPPTGFTRSMYYDGRRRTPVMLSVEGTQLVEYVWHGQGFTRTASAALGSSVFSNLPTCYDEGRDRAVLFNSLIFAAPVRAGVLEWDGRGLIEPTPGGPTARRGVASTWDSGRERLVSFGGNESDGGPNAYQLATDTWGWGDRHWTRLPSASAPPARTEHVMTHDPASGLSYVFGGSDGVGVLGDTWAFDGAGWAPVLTSTAPSPRRLAAVSWDPARGVAVLFGGTSEFGNQQLLRRGDTWEFDGREWTRTSTLGPSPRAGAAMVWDPVRGQTLLFGGFNRGTAEDWFDDLWAWDGARWTRLEPPGPRPIGRTDAALVWDTRRERVVLFGGGDNNVARQDVWEWDGSAWTQVTPEREGPVSRYRHATGFDPERGELVVSHGTAVGWTPLGDTWALEPPGVPAVQLAATLPAELVRDRVEALTIRADCGGRAPAASGAATGAVLWAWMDGRWTELAATVADLPDPSRPEAGRMVWRSPDAVTARGLIGPGEKVWLQCRSAGESGQGRAEVGLDWAEVRVAWR